MLGKFFGSAGSVAVLAVSLTPEMTNALAILVAAIFVGCVNFYMARTSRMLALAEMSKQLLPVSKQIDALAPVVAKIEAHVNSEKTRAEGEHAAQKQQIELQREMIDELKKAAALLAQAKVTSDVAGSVAQAAMAGAVQPASVRPAPVTDTTHLAQIETNTDITAKNTAKTDDTISKLKDNQGERAS